MTTAHRVRPVPPARPVGPAGSPRATQPSPPVADIVALPSVNAGERARRRAARRRQGREQLLVVLLMVLALVITLAVLAQQWLASSVPGSGNSGLAPVRPGILVVLTSNQRSTI